MEIMAMRGMLMVVLGAFLSSSSIALGEGSGAERSAEAGQSGDGARLYRRTCASCHGRYGQGSRKAPALIGAHALPVHPRTGQRGRKIDFHTAEDVFTFIRAAMPPRKPGRLSDEQDWAILAFVLQANGFDLKGRRLDASTAPSIDLTR